MESPNISLEGARKFLHTDPIGKRLLTAEYALTLLRANELPFLHRYVFNATFSFREMLDPESFEESVGKDCSISKASKASVGTGHVKVHLDQESFRIFVFYRKELSMSEAILFSRSLCDVTAVTYAALGIDMRGGIFVETQGFEEEIPEHSEQGAMRENRTTKTNLD